MPHHIGHCLKVFKWSDKPGFIFEWLKSIGRVPQSAISKHFLCYQILSMCFIVELIWGSLVLSCFCFIFYHCVRINLFLCWATFSPWHQIWRRLESDSRAPWIAHTIGMQKFRAKLCEDRCTVQVCLHDTDFDQQIEMLFQKGHFPLYIFYKICIMKELQHFNSQHDKLAVIKT